MRKKAIKILWSTYAALLLLGAIVVLCVEQGWIGYMPPIDELQNPISKYASQVMVDLWAHGREVKTAYL